MSDAYDRLGKELANGLGDGPPAERRARRRERLLERYREQQHRSQWRYWRPAVAALGGALAAFLVWVTVGQLSQEAPLECRTGAGQAVAEGQWIEATVGNPRGLRFSEGSTVAVQPRSRVRLGKLTHKQVHIALEKGTLEPDIRSTGEVTWTFQAGPYQARVLGTRFAIHWNAESRALDLSVAHGTVRVSGGGIHHDGLTLSAGQHLRADATGAKVELLANRTQQGAAADPVVDAGYVDGAPDAEGDQDHLAPDTRADSNALPRRAPPRRPRRNPLELDRLQRLLVRGEDYGAIVAEARRLGLSRVVEAMSGAQLLELADAARYSGAPGEAKRVLLAVRRRFSSQRSGKDAAFRLGRLAWDQLRDYAQAARWFQTYLGEDPSPALAADAEGRLMVALSRLGRAQEARQVAQRYLQRHPDGDFAETARSLLENADAAP